MSSIFKKDYLYLITGTALIFLIYYIISATANDNFVFPSFSLIFKSFGEMLSTGTLYVNIGYSFLRIVLSLLMSLFLSLIFSFLYIVFRPSYILIKPLIFIMKVSPLAIISLYLWMQAGAIGTTYIVSFMVMFPLMIEANIAAIDNIGKSIIDELRLNSASIFTKFFKVYIPMISPFIIMSILQCFGLGFKVVVMTEYLCLTPNSIGRYLYDLKLAFDNSGMLSLLIIIILIVAIFEVLIHLLKKYMTKLSRIN